MFIVFHSNRVHLSSQMIPYRAAVVHKHLLSEAPGPKHGLLKRECCGAAGNLRCSTWGSRTWNNGGVGEFMRRYWYTVLVQFWRDWIYLGHINGHIWILHSFGSHITDYKQYIIIYLFMKNKWFMYLLTTVYTCRMDPVFFNDPFMIFIHKT